MQHIAVFDTNVLLSSLLSHNGNPFLCVAMARAGTVGSVSCAEILAEFDEKLRVKFAYSPERAALAVDEVRKVSRIVVITNQLKAVAADPDDDKVIECALTGGATHIVTGDKHHLLPLKSHSGVEIVTPAAFVAFVRSTSASP